MGDRRGVALEHLHPVLFFEHLGLEAKLIEVLGHALEVDGDRRLLEVVDLLGPDQCVLAYELAITVLTGAGLTCVLDLGGG